MTPFAPRALDRGLSGVLVSLVRLTRPQLNPNPGAQEMDPAEAQSVLDRVVERARAVTGRDEVASLVRTMAENRLRTWRRRVDTLTGGVRLGYKGQAEGKTLNLLEPPGDGPWTEMTVLHSLREVEPTVNLVVAGEMDGGGGRGVSEEAVGPLGLDDVPGRDIEVETDEAGRCRPLMQARIPGERAETCAHDGKGTDPEGDPEPS